MFGWPYLLAKREGALAAGAVECDTVKVGDVGTCLTHSQLLGPGEGRPLSGGLLLLKRLWVLFFVVSTIA